MQDGINYANTRGVLWPRKKSRRIDPEMQHEFLDESLSFFFFKLGVVSC